MKRKKKLFIVYEVKKKPFANLHPGLMHERPKQGALSSYSW